MKEQIDVFGLVFENVTLAGATEIVLDRAKSGEKSHLVVTPNVDHIVSIQDDAHMRAIFASASLRFADGMPLVWLSRATHSKGLIERVTGADLLLSICASAAREGLRVFLLGGAPGVAEIAADRLVQANPGLDIAGTYSPPFGFEHDEQACLEITRIIHAARADILFVALGTPKQEKWLARWLFACNVGVALGVGAALDFAAGEQHRAPRRLQRLGMEWLWRLAKEPRRLAYRYLVRGSLFIPLALNELRRAKRRGRRAEREI